jgi:hypothetical protein
MSQLKEKTTSIFYLSLFEAAERFYEKDPATALEIYHSFFKYAFCRTEEVETDNEIAELIVKQTVASLNASDERYAKAVINGDKGKEYGVLGKEYGKLGGRPRKGETREEYWERKRKECEENPPKNPPLSPVIETPLTSALASSSTSTTTISSSSTESISSTSSLDKDADYYLKNFLSNPTKDYRCLLDNVPYFINRNNSDLLELQENLKKKCNCDYTLNDIISSLQFLYKEKIGYRL